MRNLFVVLEAASSVALEHASGCKCLSCRAAGGDATALAELLLAVQKQKCDCPSGLISLDCPVHGDAAMALVVEAIDHGRAIMAQPPGRCELCGAVEETRPYGPKGEEVCFDCGMKDEESAKRGFERRFDFDALDAGRGDA